MVYTGKMIEENIKDIELISSILYVSKQIKAFSVYWKISLIK